MVKQIDRIPGSNNRDPRTEVFLRFTITGIRSSETTLAPVTEEMRERAAAGSSADQDIVARREAAPGYAIHAAWSEHRAEQPIHQSLPMAADGSRRPDIRIELDQFFSFLRQWKADCPAGFADAMAEYILRPMADDSVPSVQVDLLHGGDATTAVRDRIIQHNRPKAKAAYHLLHEMGLGSSLVLRDAEHPQGLSPEAWLMTLADRWDDIRSRMLDMLLRSR